MRFDRYEESRKRYVEWPVVAKDWLLGALFVAFVIAACIALCVPSASAAAVPPRPRLARHLTGERIAAVVAAAPDGAKISVPTSAMREWSAAQHVAGDTCSYSGAVYVCVQGHRALPSWQPPAVPALWRLVRAPGEMGIPAWRQPLGAHDSYALGARVQHAGKTWESTVAANVWAPGVYGWKEVEN